MNPQSYYTLASYCKIISDQKNNFLALLIRYQYSSSDENGTYMKTLSSKEKLNRPEEKKLYRPEVLTGIYFQCKFHFQYSVIKQNYCGQQHEIICSRDYNVTIGCITQNS